MQRIKVYCVLSDVDSIVDWAWMREISFDSYRCCSSSKLYLRIPLQCDSEFLRKFRDSVCLVDSTVEIGHHLGYRL
jgi:hypothetical protein